MSDGCDCTDLCNMGPTCPGAIAAGLNGAGCRRAVAQEEVSCEDCDLRGRLADVIGASDLVPFYASSQVARSLSLELADAVLSSGLVVPAAIHKVATDALEAGDACGAVGCRALVDRDAAWGVIEKVRTVADYWANADGEGATERDLTAINTTNRLGRALHAALDTTPRA